MVSGFPISLAIRSLSSSISTAGTCAAGSTFSAARKPTQTIPPIWSNRSTLAAASNFSRRRIRFLLTAFLISCLLSLGSGKGAGPRSFLVLFQTRLLLHFRIFLFYRFQARRKVVDFYRVPETLNDPAERFTFLRAQTPRSYFSRQRRNRFRQIGTGPQPGHPEAAVRRFADRN